MRPERNPLDLNNLPEDYTRDIGKQVLEADASSFTGYRKKKSGAKDGKDECGKVYECRFCSLKFCKSQALGGHMNRHRQERETETLNKARQLVFGNDTLLPQGAPHLGCHAFPNGGYHQAAGNMADPATIPFRSVYPTRFLSASSTTLLPPPPPGQPPPPPPPQPYMYPSPPRLVSLPTQYPVNEYFIGHVLPGNNHPNTNYAAAAPPDNANTSTYTCIGAPVGVAGVGPTTMGRSNGSSRGGSEGGAGHGGRDVTNYNNQDEGMINNWGRGYNSSGLEQQQRLEPSLINRFHDGF